MDDYYAKLREKGIVPFHIVSEREGNKVTLLFSPFERSIIITTEHEYYNIIVYDGSISFIGSDDGIGVYTEADEKIINIYSCAILYNDKLRFDTNNPVQELMESMTEEIARTIADQILVYLIDFRKANPLTE